MSLGTSMDVGPGGTAGANTTLVESQNGRHRTADILITSGTQLVVTPDNESLGDGILIYTFPAGTIIVNKIYGDVGLEIDDSFLVGDTPEVALGGSLTDSAVATTGQNQEEDLWGPHVVTGCETGAAPTDAIQQMNGTAGLNIIILAAASHAVYLNCADAWAAGGAGTKDVVVQNGRFIIDYTLIPNEGT